MLPSILGSSISPISYPAAVARITQWARQRESRSVYAANAHMLMVAHDHSDFRQIVNDADLVTPDGMPLVWALHMKGYKNQERVYGPTLMLKVLQAAADQKIPIGFLGSTDEVLDQLSAKMAATFPGLKIGVCASLPFRSISVDEDAALCESIKASGVRILFIALGCPKQERWIAAHRGKIDAVMLGVGAAFAFHAGAVRQAPHWMQKMGLEWLFRFSQEPRRLWRRYLVNNPRFVILLLAELLHGRFSKHSRPGGDVLC